MQDIQALESVFENLLKLDASYILDSLAQIDKALALYS